MRLFAFLAAVVGITTCVTGEENCLVCKSVSRVSTVSCNGLKGPAGPPGEVDYDRVDETLRTELQKMKRQLNCHGGVVVGTTCYRLLYTSGVQVNYARARDLCHFQGGRLAEIPTEEAYIAIYNYVKRAWNVDLNHVSRDHVVVYLGSVYRDGKVYLQNGTQSYVRWHAGSPKNDAGFNRMFMTVPIVPERVTNIGMFNEPPSRVDLCQFPVD